MISKDYALTLWADGFANWHAKAVFTIPLGNTGPAYRVLDNARAAARRAIRREILARSPRNTTTRDLAPIRLTVSANSSLGTGQLSSITWKESI